MNSPSKEIKEKFINMLKKATANSYPRAGLEANEINNSITVPRDEFGDLSSSIPFKLAKLVKENPNAIADKLVEELKKEKSLKDVKAVNGYVNIWINSKEYVRLVIEGIFKNEKKYGSSDIGKGNRVIIESPSVNPNKPWHIGHLRNAILGDAVSNIFEKCSFEVEREDLINDLGLQVAESFWGYGNLSSKPDKKFDLWLGEQYVEVNKRMNDENVVAQVKELLKNMEKSDSKESKESREISERCVKAQYETSGNYNIYHNILIWESDILREKFLEKAIDIAVKSKVLKKENEGKYANCIVVDLERVKKIAKDFESPSEEVKVIIRSDGTATYVAKDLAFHMWKFGMLDDTFKYNLFIEKQRNGKPLYTTASSGKNMKFGGVQKVVNVIDSSQRYPQLILRSIFMLMGREDIAKNIMHLSYGIVGIEEGTLSGREGGWIGDKRSYTADSLLEETTKKALEIVLKSEKIKDKSKAEETAKKIALGAVKFEYLRIAPEKNVTFSWSKALSFEGNSGPYCMYMYARASRILEKETFDKNLNESDYNQITDRIDFKLVKLLGSSGEVLEKACEEYRPNVITDYLLELSLTFSKFYETMPVIKGGEAKRLRLALVHSTKQVIGNTLSVLGIESVERM